MGTIDSSDILALLRHGARNLLEIPSDSTDEAVRRHCLDRLETEEFRLDNDVDAAIRILCGDPSAWAGLPPNAPQLARHVERLVRGELERVALRLRTEPATEVRPALEAMRERADLFPSTELWRNRLETMSKIAFPPSLADSDQTRVLGALVECATTWPGEAGRVRRRHLEELVPRARFERGARLLCKKFPGLRGLDPLLLAAVEGSPPPLSPRHPPQHPQGGTKQSRVQQWLSDWMIVLLVPVGIGIGSWVNVSNPPAPRPRPVSFPSSNPLPGGVISSFGSAVYAPWKGPTVPGLAPGEKVKLLPFQEDRVMFFVPETKKAYRVPKRDVLSTQTAASELEERTTEHPGDVLAWVAYANVAMDNEDPAKANRCYEQATRLGADLVAKTVDGKPFWTLVRTVEVAPVVPPPPPLPILVEEGAL